MDMDNSVEFTAGVGEGWVGKGKGRKIGINVIE